VSVRVLLGARVAPYAFLSPDMFAAKDGSRPASDGLPNLLVLCWLLPEQVPAALATALLMPALPQAVAA